MATQTTTPPAPLVPTSAMATEPVSVDLETDAEAMSKRFFAGALATLELATIHLGLRLGCTRRCTTSDPSPLLSSPHIEDPFWRPSAIHRHADAGQGGGADAHRAGAVCRSAGDARRTGRGGQDPARHRRRA
jgi:hypothetical protein